MKNNNKPYLFNKIGTNPIAPFNASAKVQWNSKYYIPENMYVANPQKIIFCI